jgi:hypothetical protein
MTGDDAKIAHGLLPTDRSPSHNAFLKADIRQHEWHVRFVP